MDQRSLYGDFASCLREKRVEQQSETALAVEGDFVFPRDYCGFDGHFPGQPILPAIVQLAAARFLAEHVLQLSLFPREVNKVKFKGMVQPGDAITVRIELEKKDAAWQGGIKLRNSNGQLLSSGQFVLETEG